MLGDIEKLNTASAEDAAQGKRAGAGGVIMFIDEIHTVLGAGKGDGAMDAANLLKPALARGTLRCIGATTLAEYRQYIEKDTAFERRFQMVQVRHTQFCLVLGFRCVPLFFFSFLLIRALFILGRGHACVNQCCPNPHLALHPTLLTRSAHPHHSRIPLTDPHHPHTYRSLPHRSLPSLLLASPSPRTGR